jgi:hypothetical protein
VKREIKERYGKGDVISPARRIFDLEYEKQKLLMEGKETVSAFVPEASLQLSSESRNIQFSGEDRFLFDTDRGYEVSATLADLISDLKWGNYYTLPAQTSLALKQQYAAAYYKSRMDDIHDHQLVIQRLEIDKVSQKDMFLGIAYEEVKKRIEGEAEYEQAGIIFEKMIANLLSKIAQDIPELTISIEHATVVEDVELKIDFIIHVNNKKRGVGVTEFEGDKTLGIQFTLRDKDDDYRVKEKQIAQRQKNLKDVDELLIVSVPVSCKEVMGVYGKWKNQGKPAGGPENLLDPVHAANYISSVLQQTHLVEEPGVKEKILNYLKSKKV